MTSFQDAPDENIEHDEKMELRSVKTTQKKATHEKYFISWLFIIHAKLVATRFLHISYFVVLILFLIVGVGLF